MSIESPPVLGTCPFCEAEIRSINVLIEYETDDGEAAVFAECPDCEDVAHPE